jgi:hypothetical protein
MIKAHRNELKRCEDEISALKTTQSDNFTKEMASMQKNHERALRNLKREFEKREKLLRGGLANANKFNERRKGRI